jgi:hypothetical protein
MSLLRMKMLAEDFFVLCYVINLGSKGQATMKKHCKAKLGYDPFPASSKVKMLGKGSTDPIVDTFMHQNKKHDFYYHEIDKVIGDHILSKVKEAEGLKFTTAHISVGGDHGGKAFRGGLQITLRGEDGKKHIQVFETCAIEIAKDSADVL